MSSATPFAAHEAQHDLRDSLASMTTKLLDEWLAEADGAAGAPPSAALLAEVDAALADPST